MIKCHQLLFGLIVLTITQYSCMPNIHAVADFIIFSYDRPMQLYALLESTEHYLTGIDCTTVIYRTSDIRFAHAYKIVQQRFAHVQFVSQGNNPQGDFKPLLMKALKESKSSYILFAPDDIIVKNYADLQVCAKAMEEYNAYGFFLRLGTHLNASYAYAQPQPIPPLADLNNNLCSWTFADSDSKFDWGYPNNVDMTIYRKSETQTILETKSFTNPYTMEASWG